MYIFMYFKAGTNVKYQHKNYTHTLTQKKRCCDIWIQNCPFLLIFPFYYRIYVVCLCMIFFIQLVFSYSIAACDGMLLPKQIIIFLLYSPYTYKHGISILNNISIKPNAWSLYIYIYIFIYLFCFITTFHITTQHYFSSKTFYCTTYM